jgi:hypothetical protein
MRRSIGLNSKVIANLAAQQSCIATTPKNTNTATVMTCWYVGTTLIEVEVLGAVLMACWLLTSTATMKEFLMK